jgi:hypothetical protein
MLNVLIFTLLEVLEVSGVVIPSFNAKLNTHSMCAQESS